MNNEISKRIKQLRTKSGQKQSIFAKTIGVHQNAISYWETGRRLPNAEDLIKIADKYDVSLDWLCGRERK